MNTKALFPVNRTPYVHIRRRACTAASARILLAAGWAPLSYADGVEVYVDGISATATVDATSTILRVGGPGGHTD